MLPKSTRLFAAALLLVLVASLALAQDKFYNPPSHIPPGPPPNYNLVDSSYFQGVPNLSNPTSNYAGSYYIWNDTAVGKWYVATFVYSPDKEMDQFHGSILVQLDQAPQPYVNIWPLGFEYTDNLKENDRWGWVKWPDSIAPNLYEVWWDITIDYAKRRQFSDYSDTLGICVSGCAIDFNIWSSNTKCESFGTDDVFLGDNKTKLSTVPGFSDTYSGVTDQYQVNDPEDDPNTSRFTAASGLPGATYNKYGLISGNSSYENRYEGSWAYQANGVQFATLFCPLNHAPTFVGPPVVEVTSSLCGGASIFDTIVATDPNSGDGLVLTQLSGPGSFSSTSPSNPVYGYVAFAPLTSGLYTWEFEVSDGHGGFDTLTLIKDVTVNTPPEVDLGVDTVISLCGPAEICLPVEIIDPDCNVNSVTTSHGTYSGTLANYDQIDRILELGGTVTQIGGGAPGTVLVDAGDFVPPINTQSGVAVTLPNFIFASYIADYGSFPNGFESGNSADYLIGAPTDLTFTSPGAGGPDGGAGDGSIAFATGYYVKVGFAQDVTACHGANVDFIVFTNTAGGGTAELKFYLDGVVVHTITRVIPGGSAASGTGGVTFDLPDGITFDEVRVACVGSTLEVDAFAARTAPSTTSTDICFDADTSGVYEIVVEAVDGCGATGSDTRLVTIQINQPPVANAGPDQTLFVCQFGQVCLPVSFSDPDGNLKTTSKVSGPGTLSGNQICFTPAGPGAFTFVIKATDSCGLIDLDTVVVTVDNNDPPVIATTTPQSAFQCAGAELCYQFSAVDPNGGSLGWSVLAGTGSVDATGTYCFTPDTAGVYAILVVATDSCGAADTAGLQYAVGLNSAPVAVIDPGEAVFQCDPTEVCFDFDASDVDGGALVWSVVTAPGTVDAAGHWCFTPTASGDYTATVAVTDGCGAADTTSKTFTVTLNTAPTVAFGSDTSLALCEPQQICVVYTPGDADGLAGLSEVMVSGVGALDTAANTICFTPAPNDNTYEIIVRVSDPCGDTDEDTIVVTVDYGLSAAISCPTGPINVALCSPDEICQMLTVAPASAAVTTSFGTFAANQLCFTADTSGQYVIEVIASESCGADTCELVFNVTIGSAAQINCPGPVDLFLCETDQVCLPIGINGSGVSVTVSPFGSYAGGMVCFPADSSGHYEIQVIASTSCGADTCTVVADITINSNPVIAQSAPVDTFLCAPAEICRTLSASDVDGGPITFSRLSGAGTVSPAGLWCFTPTTAGSYTITAVATDSCGARDTVSVTYTVTLNIAPVVSLGPDQNLFLCGSETICVNYTATDANSNITSLQVLSATGTLDQPNSRVCFTPTGPGVFKLILSATDACGAVDVDTVKVTVSTNSAPVVSAGANLNVSQCTPTQICVPVVVSDVNGNLADLVKTVGPGTLSGGQLCFTPTASFCYEFVFVATDSCGAVGVDTLAICVDLNESPVASAGADQNLFLCEPEEICWSASCTDPDNNLSTCALVAGPGTYDGSQICFTPAASGSYRFIVEASDACGRTDRDTVDITVTINSDPVCSVPNDTLIFQCDAVQVCLPAGATDADGNLSFCQVNVGTIQNGLWCYTPVADQTVTVTMICEDACGAVCQTEFTVQFEINDAPEIAFSTNKSAVTVIEQCQPEEICLPYIVNDENLPRPLTVTLVSGSGTLDLVEEEVCFTPVQEGLYQFIIRVEDECGEFDQDTVEVIVELNSPPVASAGNDQTLSLCQSSQICWPAGCSDVDGNLTDCIFTGPGVYDGSQICFTPTASGVYQFSLQAIDACGETSFDQVTITVTLNASPQIALGNDTLISLCSPTQICLPYTVSDPDGLAGLVERMQAGFGAIDTVANQICFVPTTAGTYQFIVRLNDACDAIAKDTMVVTVEFGDEVEIVNCPSGPINVSLCDPDQVCYMLTVEPTGATVTTSLGTYVNGEICFLADTSGIYLDTVIASGDCGADTCILSFNVDIGSAAAITCADPASLFICAADTVCLPISAMGQGVSISVSPIGWVTAGNVCFVADTSGHYELEVIATTDCGSDTCTLIADITINSRPVAVDPPSPVDTFICETGTICYQFAAGDVDPGSLTWMMIAGDGTMSSQGLWCFDTDSSAFNQTYTLTAKVSDACGAADTVTLTYNVTLNAPAFVFQGNPPNVVQCQPEEICTRLWILNQDGGSFTVNLLSAVGEVRSTPYADSVDVCFTPDTAGTYQFSLRVTDSCGAQTFTTALVTVHLNVPPVVNAGPDQNLFQCTVGSQVCWPVSSTDADGNLDSTLLVSGAGTYANGNICFTPDTTATYLFVMKAVDDCGLTDFDSVSITVRVNTPPVCQVPNDTLIFQCQSGQISLPVSGTDADNNFDHCEIVTGPGSIVNGNWVFTPTTSGAVSVTVMCIDDCGATCQDQFTVTIDLNNAPVVNAGVDQTVFLCGSQQVCWPVSITDSDGNITAIDVLNENGTYDSANGRLCFTVPSGGERSYTFILRATDACGQVDADTVKLTVELNGAPVLDLPPDFVAYLSEPGEVCFGIDALDPDNNIVDIEVNSPGLYVSGLEQICFDADTTGVYCFEVIVTDACGRADTGDVCVEVMIDECIHVQIEKVHNAIQGQITQVHVYLNGSGHELGGFDFLITYDASVLSFTDARPGEIIDTSGCGWEYFTYRVGADGNCAGVCPTGLVRVVAVAEWSNGAYHPSCFLQNNLGELVDLDFLVTNDRTAECQYAEIGFFWADCADNAMSGRIGDTLWVQREIFDFEGRNITENDFGLPGRYGIPDGCLTPVAPGKPAALRCIDFTNGGIDIVCADSIDAAGDINLNEIPFEIADAVLFSNYFVYGFTVFDSDPLRRQGQIAASDVNKDGLTLSVADLVYLIRVVVGDDVAYPKIHPGGQMPSAELSFTDQTLRILSTDARIGAVSLVIDGEAHPQLHRDAAGMSLEYNFDGQTTRVLVYNLDAEYYLETGSVVTFDCEARIQKVEIGSFDGFVMEAKLNLLPTHFSLSQNYPNPFNPVTTIEFALPVASEWELEVVNILGQTVSRFGDKSEPGYIKIEWDASDFASGVYFYRLRAGDFSDTRKMVLLK